MQYSTRPRRVRASLALVALVILVAPPASAAVPQTAPERLEVGRPVERRLAGGEAHLFEVTLAAGDYLRGVVMQRGVDVRVRVLAPDGAELLSVDSPNGTKGPEAVKLVVESAGIHRVEVAALTATAPAGDYAYEFDAPRAATAADRAIAEGERAYRRAMALVDSRTPDAFAKTAAELERALALYREAGYRLGEADTLRALGATVGRSGDKLAALGYYEKELPVRIAMKDRSGEAGCYNVTGGAYLALSQRDRALEHFEKALAIYRELGRTKDEAELLNNIGVGLHGRGEAELALDYYLPALELLRKDNDRKSESVMLKNIGSSFAALGDRDKALEYYDRSLELARETKWAWSEANTLFALGSLHSTLGDKEKAFAYLDEALAIRRASGDRLGVANTLSYAGYVRAASGDVEKGAAMIEESLAMWRELRHRAGEAAALQNLGIARSEAGDHDAALALFAQARAYFAGVEDDAAAGSLLVNIAKTERDAGRLEQALGTVDKALAVYERLRARVGPEALRASYGGQIQWYYEIRTDILMRLAAKDPAKWPPALALEASERARARTFVEALSSGGAEIRRGVDPALLLRERALQAKMSAQSAEVTRLLGAKAPEPQRAAARAALDGLWAEYEGLQARLRETSPRYAALTQPATVGADSIRGGVLGEGEVLLEYMLGRERSYLWVVTRDGVRGTALPPREEVEKASRALLAALTARGTRVKFETPAARAARVARADGEAPTLAATLSRMVLAPAASEVVRAKRVLVAADGVLQYVPLAALPAALPDATGSEPDLAPLGIGREVVNVPSASALTVLRREVAARPPAPQTIAVLADPVFDAADARVKPAVGPAVASPATARAPSDLTRAIADVDPSGGELRLPRLPFTRREADAILALTPSSARRAAFDFAASREVATGPELSRYRVVHFATHGFINSARPELSGLALSMVDERGAPRDGFLRAADVYNLALPADLVVLSGCRTGLGREVRGEGMMGLTRGFFYAGAARVLVSLWDVHDEGTSELMARFYKALLGPGRPTPAAALREAQASMYRDPRWRAPYYWAAFVLHGEPR